MKTAFSNSEIPIKIQHYLCHLTAAEWRLFMRRIISVLLAALMMCSTLAVCAFAYPEHEDYIHDGGLFLDEGTKSSVKEASDALYEAKGVRIAVCTVDSTGDETTADFASGVFTEWEPGNAVLILMVRDKNAYYGIQNNGVVEYLSNEKILEVLDSGLKESFEAKEGYADALLTTVRSFSSYLTERVSEPLSEESAGGMPKALSVILKIVFVLALILIAGYVALIVLEKRQAQKRRAYLEERRRRMARDGRGAYRPAAQRSPNGRPTGRGQNGRPVRPPQGGRAPGTGVRPVTGGARQPYGNTRPVGRIPSTQTQGAYRGDGRARPMERRDVASAATVQINTADIRAAMKNRDKYSSK